MMGDIPILPQIYDLFYGGDAGMKLEASGRLFRRYGAEMRQEPRLTVAVMELCSLHKELSLQMLAMEMDCTCTLCAQGKGGGCCSAAFSAETDVAQLLMNMLAGVAVDIQRNNGTDCCYLGEKGCIFLFKPMFCLNYNCSSITLSGRHDDLRKLEMRTGMMLRAQQDAENAMIDFFKGKRGVFKQPPQ